MDSGEIIKAEKALIAVGVKGNVEELGLKKCGVIIEKNCIKVNEFMQTGTQNIYAIGDVCGPPLLALVASFEGTLAVEHLSGMDIDPIEYGNVPGCTYCEPEIASVG